MTPQGAAVTSKPDTICSRCIDAIQHARDELPILKSALRAFVQPPMTSKYGGDSVGGTREPPAPANVSVLDLINRIIDVLHDAGDYAIKDLVTLPATERVTWANGRAGKGLVSGVDIALSIRDAFNRADKVIGLNSTWENRMAPCPSCKTFSLGGWVGSETVTCTSCGVSTTAAEYQQNNLIQVRERGE